MSELLRVSLRSLALALLAVVCLWRARSAALKHAVWSLVTAGMLLQLPLGQVFPPVRLAVLRSIEIVPATAALPSVVMTAPAPPPRGFPVIPVIYLAGLGFPGLRLLRALIFTRGLIRRSERVAPGRYEGEEIAVPMTACSKVLLPLGWRDWDATKLQAVLAHEGAHLRRRDWWIALLARMNCCVFWFHPLAWWLERRLAQLAEQACDDAALLTVEDRRTYARTLLEMARVVSAQGRFVTIAMAKEAKVETRINRILDESRRIPKALGRGGWAALAAFAAPLMYFAAAAQLAPAQSPLPIGAAAPPSQESPLVDERESPGFAPLPTLPMAPGTRFQNPAVPLAHPGPPLSVSFSPLRSGVIAIPLSGPGEHRVLARVTTEDRLYVAERESVVTGPSWELPFSLKPGLYRVQVYVKTGGERTVSRLDFDVQ